MKNIIEAADLPLDEKVYLKKDTFGWRVVEPPTKWYHWITGSKRNFFNLIFIMFVMYLAYIGINEMVDNYKTIAEEPCRFCTSCHEETARAIQSINRANTQYVLDLEGVNLIEEEE